MILCPPVLRRAWRGAGALALSALLLACSSTSGRPDPAPLPPDPKLLGLRQAWSVEIGKVAFPLVVQSVGNTVGVAQVESDLIVTKEAPAAVFYTVKKGDTLWKIAETHYGKGQGAKYTEIVKANTPPVKNPDLIQPGWVLRIPPAA